MKGRLILRWIGQERDEVFEFVEGATRRSHRHKVRSAQKYCQRRLRPAMDQTKRNGILPLGRLWGHTHASRCVSLLCLVRGSSGREPVLFSSERTV